MPLEVREKAFAYHTFLRCVFLRKRCLANVAPANKRLGLMAAADRVREKSLGGLQEHPVVREIMDDVAKEQGSLALATGLSLLKGGGTRTHSDAFPGSYDDTMGNGYQRPGGQQQWGSFTGNPGYSQNYQSRGRGRRGGRGRGRLTGRGGRGKF